MERPFPENFDGKGFPEKHPFFCQAIKKMNFAKESSIGGISSKNYVHTP